MAPHDRNAVHIPICDKNTSHHSRLPAPGGSRIEGAPDAPCPSPRFHRQPFPLWRRSRENITRNPAKWWPIS